MKLFNSVMLRYHFFIISLKYRPRQYLPTGHDHFLSWRIIFSIYNRTEDRDTIPEAKVNIPVLCSSHNSRGSGVGGGSSSSICVDITQKINISGFSIFNSSSSSFCSFLKYFNMYCLLGTSVRVFRHPALPSGCEPCAAASEQPFWATWSDELPDKWRRCVLQSGRSTKLLP